MKEIWLTHKNGFTKGFLVEKMDEITGRCKVKVAETGLVYEVGEDDIENVSSKVLYCTVSVHNITNHILSFPELSRVS